MPNRFSVIRADDLLVCQLEFVGITVSGTAPNRRLTVSGGADAIVVAHFPPQSVAEEAFPEQRATTAGTSSAIIAESRRGGDYAESRIAGPSQVAFRIDPSALPIPFRLADILALLSASALEVVPSAARDLAPGGCLNLVALLRSIFDPPGLTRPEASALNTCRPLGLTSSPHVDASPLSTTVGSRRRRSQTRTLPSSPALITWRPSGANATARAGP